MPILPIKVDQLAVRYAARVTVDLPSASSIEPAADRSAEAGCHGAQPG